MLEQPMKVQAMRCLVGLMAWAALAGQVMAQDAGTGGAARVTDLPPSPTDPVYGPTSQPIDSSQLQGGQVYQPMAVDQIFAPAFRVDARGGNLYGYNGGFTNVGAYAPYLVDPNTLLFIDGRGLITDYSRGGANVGVGWRFYDEDFDRVWGLNAWYDHDGGHARKYNQVGVGFESLGRYFDMRLNGYLPIGNDSNVLSSTPDANSLGFSQQFITFLQRNTIENAYTGFDSEIGGPMPILGRYGMSGYAGFYFFTNSTGGDFTGVSGRFNQRINEDLQLSVQLTHDHKFGSNAQIQVIAQIPNGWPSKWLRQKRVYDRLADPVFRNYRVIAGQDVVSKTERLINPIDGQPFFVAHIDPNLVAPGNGNIESPFNSLAGFNGLAGPLKSQYDLIYVRPRTDGTSTNLDTGLQLLDRQRLLSTSVAHTIVGQGASGGPIAQFNLPVISGFGTDNPLLRNNTAGAPVAQLANRNEVSGFTIDGTNSLSASLGTYNVGIRSQPGTIDSFDINRNTFNNTLDAVRIESADALGLGFAGPAIGVLENNVVSGRGFSSNNGFVVNHSGGQLNLRVADNRIAGVFTEVTVGGVTSRVLQPNTGVRGEDRNNNGVLDPTEDLNANGVLDPGEDANANGVLDLAEDNNGNGALDIGIAMDIRSTGAGTVINAAGTAAGFDYKSFDSTLPIPGPAPITLGILNNPNIPTGQPAGNVGGNGAGISLTAAAGSIFTADVQNNRLTGNTFATTIAGNERGFGFRGQANGGTLRLNTFSGNDLSNNAQDGAQLFATGGGSLQVLQAISNQTFNSNGGTAGSLLGDGLSLLSSGGSNMQLVGITNNEFSANTNDGLKVATQTNGTIAIANPLTGNTFGSTTALAGNGSDGLDVSAASGVISLQIGAAGDVASATGGTNRFVGNGNQSTGVGSGINMQVSQNGAIFTAVRGASVTGNAGTGMVFDLDDALAPSSGRINALDITSNFVTGNGSLTTTTGDGMAILNGNGGIFETNGLVANNFSNNRRAGLFLGGTVGGATSFNDLNTVTRNNFNRDTIGTEGILFDTLNTETTMTLTQNTFVGRLPAAGPPAVASSGRGIGGTVNGGGLIMSLPADDIGNPLNTTNTFTNNGDAHIGLILAGDSANQITIDGHIFNGAVNSSNALETRFQGDGLGFIVEDTALLTGFIRGSTITNNVRDGIHMEVRGNSLTDFAQITNFQIGGATAAQGNTITLNGSDGISFERTDGGRVVNALIANNTIERNGTPQPPVADPAFPNAPVAFGVGNGISLNSANRDVLDTYTIANNFIRRNAENGILLFVEADADLSANIDNNVIASNGRDGIQTNELTNDPSDNRSVRGSWTRNRIANNRRDGIHLNGTPQTLVIGDAVTASLGNIVTENGANGINVLSPGTFTIGNNTITFNGDPTGSTLGQAGINPATGLAFETAGIKANVRPFSNLSIISNRISNNFGDGIEHGIPGNFSGFQAILNVDRNIIDSNTGRGLDLINRNSNFTQATITDNIINLNGLEGIYLVNTSSGSQNQLSTTRGQGLSILAADGPFDARPVYEAQISGNQIINNGNNSGQSATGLLVRVGTAGGFNSITNPGGFASIGGPVAVGTGPFGNSTFFGGVTMTVDNNQFGGNFGDDVRFHSFVSTVTPATSQGTWSDTEFTPNVGAYQSDPLARLDLYFRGNTFDSHDVNNGEGVGSQNTQEVAFYNNPEAVFKSRVFDNNAATIQDGPFDNASRRRNAQRQAARIPFFDAPNPGNDGNIFLYSGIGDSTFRVSTDSQVGFFLIDTVVPNTNTGQQNGFFLPGAIIGERPFGWGSF
jgi:Inverse autotransporter, beta-domain/Right handed beta helix region